MTWRQYQLFLEEYERHEIKRMQELRMLIYWPLTPYLPQGTQIEDFMRLPGDATPEERKAKFEAEALALMQQVHEQFLKNNP